MQTEGVKYYYLALLLGLMIHLPMVFFTFESTYDAYVHMFFADHYASNWFENWNYKWYTGFTITSYPPLVHHIVALGSYLVGIKLAYVFWSICAVFLFIRGVYVFSRLWVSETEAGYAAILAVVSSSFLEALHIFGQLPSITGMSLLLNACPHVYFWFRDNSRLHLIAALLLIAVTTTAHHVTTIFGMIFFLMPVMSLALIDKLILRQGGIEEVGIMDFVLIVKEKILRAIFFGIAVISTAVIMILPYWLWSKDDPITQVSIPHGSRDSYIEVLSSGMVFFLIPWGLILFALPYIFFTLYRKRHIFLALSFTLLLILGTGGTTPIPRMLLGDGAFEILTLDRFTFWASIIALPFWGKFVYELIEGAIKEYLIKTFRIQGYKVLTSIYIIAIIVFGGFVMNINYFQPLQPKKIEINPIVNFLNTDKHDQWRYLTLGFGDQVAWLAANTKALSVDGNYHSVRRLPELTTRKVERLENAKYLGMQGIGALQQFLTTPEKYNLKYIFSNDKFYEPLLFFSGWDKVESLSNKIEVWERSDIPEIPAILPRKNIPKFQRYMWGVLPISVALITLLYLLFMKRYLRVNRPDYEPRIHKVAYTLNTIGSVVLFVASSAFAYYFIQKEKPQATPENVVTAYFDALDFRYFDNAYSYLSEIDKPEMESFVTQISSENGLLNSYAKLNKISSKRISANKNTVLLEVTAQWITSIKEYETTHDFTVVKSKGNWSILHNQINQYIPPNQFFRIPEVNFKNQGKRKSGSLTSRREDIIDRPEIEISDASLVKFKDQFVVVGSLTNIDNDPAFVTVEAVLFDEFDQEIIRYNVRDKIKHQLLPKESTDFRVDFEEAAFQNIKTALPKVFDPEISNPFEFLEKPVKAAIFVKSMVSDAQFYKYLGLSEVSLKAENKIEGDLVNYGAYEVSIPQILTSYYKKDNLIWLDSQYLPYGVRSQRNRDFEVRLTDINEVELIKIIPNSDRIVNGFQQKEMIKAYGQPEMDDCVSFDNIKIRLTPNGFVDY